MNIHSNIEQYAGKGVVPVLCGNYIVGTGFFFTPRNVLTAFHVVAPYLEDPSTPISIKIGNGFYSCALKDHSVEPDLAILETDDYTCDSEYVLQIVSGKFRKDQECYILGYPMELGNGEDYYVVKVKNSREKKDASMGFDRMVCRMDSLGFSSYCGFSGSPVINTSLKVIGVQTDQLYNTLGYASIASFANILQKYTDEPLESDDALYDDTTYGLGSAYQFTKSQYDRGSSRLSKGLHVKNSWLEDCIKLFFGEGLSERKERIYNSLQEWYNQLAGIYKSEADKYPNLSDYLVNKTITNSLHQSILILKGEESRGHYFYPPFLRKKLSSIEQDLEWLEKGQDFFDKSQFLCVKGKAGSGKSHFLYRMSLDLSQKVHTYLFQGFDFSEHKSPLNTICEKLGWTDDDPLASLNQNLINEQRCAVFVIDAINEGAGRSFWEYELPYLHDEFIKYPRIKLLVSIRTLSEDDRLGSLFKSDWYTIKIDGFVNTSEAIGEFFNAYHIKGDVMHYQKIQEFKNPLFLKLFCETYHLLTEEERRNVMRLPIYRKYLTYRNVAVSKGIDADPKQEVTSKLLTWVANLSVMQYQCGNIPRQQVYNRALRLSNSRLWSKNLLHHCLLMNILREYSSIDGSDYVDFEYDSLGDYLKASCLLDRRMTDEEKLAFILRLIKEMKGNRQKGKDHAKILGFVRAFLSVWNPNERIWQLPVFQDGELTDLLMSSLPDRNVKSEQNTLKSAYIDAILKEHEQFISPTFLLRFFAVYTIGLFSSVHPYLLSLPMNERDLKWTLRVNDLYRNRAYVDLLNGVEANLPVEKQTLAKLLIWMLTSSYPAIRDYVKRKLKELLSENKDIVIGLIRDFSSVDDGYIHIGLYESVYGAIATIDDSILAETISQELLRIHYSDAQSPQNLMVRYWTLKIFEYTKHLNDASTVWESAQPPFQYDLDLKAKVGDNDFSAGDYFGSSQGSKMLNHSLYHWDFSRYVIGTNWENESSVFFWNENEAVELSFISNAIAYLIKNKYGWNDRIGELDADVPYQLRSENSAERIGKKYQWLALYEVYAYLCDNCMVKVNEWSDSAKFVQLNYPWYVPTRDNYDPTLTKENVACAYSHQLFDVICPNSTDHLDVDSFLSDGIQETKLYITTTDKEGQEWVVLQAYSTIHEQIKQRGRERFVYYNPILVDKENLDEFIQWMRTENFYGRWMPERNGSTDFRWNEYPWADSYQLLDQDENAVFEEKGHQFKLAYSAQLQENTSGMVDNYDYLSTAYMPCADMMRTMNWHTAERGIIRDTDHRIVAINRSIHGDAMDALYIRKTALDQYLEQTNQVIFYCLLGELSVDDTTIIRLSGAAMYSCQDGVIVFNPLHEVSLDK